MRFCSDKLLHTFPFKYTHTQRQSANITSSQTRLCHKVWYALSARWQTLKTNWEMQVMNKQLKTWIISVAVVMRAGRWSQTPWNCATLHFIYAHSCTFKKKKKWFQIINRYKYISRKRNCHFDFTKASQCRQKKKEQEQKRLNSCKCQCTDGNLSMVQLNMKHLICLLVVYRSLLWTLSPQTSNTSPMTLQTSFLPSQADAHFI